MTEGAGAPLDGVAAAGSDAGAALLGRLREPAARFPGRPRLVPDLSSFALPGGLGLQLRGAGSPILFRGAHAAAAFACVASFDGAGGLDGLLRARPDALPAEALLRMVALLHERRLLVEAPDCEAQPGGGAYDGDLLAARGALFWGRHRALHDADTGAGHEARLRHACVLVVGTGLFGATTADLLGRLGIGALRLFAWDDDGLFARLQPAGAAGSAPFVALPGTGAEAAAALRAGLDGADLVVSALREAPAALVEALGGACLEARVPFLRGVEVGGAVLEVGPTVMPFESGCCRCMGLREASARDYAVEAALVDRALAEGGPAGARGLRGEDLAGSLLGASLLGLEVQRLLAGAPALCERVQRVEPASGRLEENTFLRVSRCEACGAGAPRSGPPSWPSLEADKPSVSRERDRNEDSLNPGDEVAPEARAASRLP